MNRAALRKVIARDLRGCFEIPNSINPSDADVAWFAANGKTWTQPREHERFRRGQLGECWANAYRASRRDPSLRYVQGLVQPAHHDLLVPHAWCVTDADALYELTWDVSAATGAEVYYGVVFSFEDLMELQNATGDMRWYDGFADILQARDLREATAKAKSK